MRHGNFTEETDKPFNWRLIGHLLPFLAESGRRVSLALLCLLFAKLAILSIPFLLKRLVDDLEITTVQDSAPILLLGLVLAYGTARFANVFFGELRDTIFGRVTERAMRRVGLQVFRQVLSSPKKHQ